MPALCARLHGRFLKEGFSGKAVMCPRGDPFICFKCKDFQIEHGKRFPEFRVITNLHTETEEP